MAVNQQNHFDNVLKHDCYYLFQFSFFLSCLNYLTFMLPANLCQHFLFMQTCVSNVQLIIGCWEHSFLSITLNNIKQITMCSTYFSLLNFMCFHQKLIITMRQYIVLVPSILQKQGQCTQYLLGSTSEIFCLFTLLVNSYGKFH